MINFVNFMEYIYRTLGAYIKNKEPPIGMFEARPRQGTGGNICLPLNPMKILARVELKTTKHHRTTATDMKKRKKLINPMELTIGNLPVLIPHSKPNHKALARGHSQKLCKDLWHLILVHVGIESSHRTICWQKVGSNSS